MQAFSPLDGALLVDKPGEWTSHDVVAKVRNHFRLEKVGHCGTLDPMATGLLILVLGKATRLSERLMASDKVYEGTLRLGETTDSYDADGELVETRPVPPLTVDDLNRVAAEFLGDLQQVPPMVSAKKVAGVPLYKLARQGKEVVREPRLVHLYTFRFHDLELPFAYFRVSCTKGTYVRSLAHDVGERLGCGAHLTALRRTSSGRFDVADATPLVEVLQWDRDQLGTHVIPLLKLRGLE
ncbi:MAG TPA: tRNA pseudouridine(55) synthase TruB [Verrucomicrobiota bacterium]|nr:tRNA pseudouridine(55) synthase TruB [Verrucomicrobiales bacterium]HRI12156.1 tRNA pseudouridine(55) synthase TruB [Verrucomicrobiota bacterium]